VGDKVNAILQEDQDPKKKTCHQQQIETASCPLTTLYTDKNCNAPCTKSLPFLKSVHTFTHINKIIILNKNPQCQSAKVCSLSAVLTMNWLMATVSCIAIGWSVTGSGRVQSQSEWPSLDGVAERKEVSTPVTEPRKWM